MSAIYELRAPASLASLAIAALPTTAWSRELSLNLKPPAQVGKGPVKDERNWRHLFQGKKTHLGSGNN